MRFTIALAMLAALGGCSQILGLDNVHATGATADAANHADAGAPDAPAPDAFAGQTLALSGSTFVFSTSGSQPLAGATITAYRTNMEMAPLAMTSSDANGSFTLDVPAMDFPLDGFLRVTAMTYEDTYLFPSTPWTGVTPGLNISLASSSTIGVAASLCNAPSPTGTGVVAVVITDSTGAPIPNNTLSVTPAAGKLCYNGSNGLPSSSAMSTAADGIAYAIGISGPVTIVGMAGFHTHVVTTHPDTITQTYLKP